MGSIKNRSVYFTGLFFIHVAILYNYSSKKGNKKRRLLRIPFIYGIMKISLRTRNFAGTKATSTGVYFFDFAVNDCTYSLNIRFPSSFCADVRVTHVHTAACGFATNFA